MASGTGAHSCFPEKHAQCLRLPVKIKGSSRALCHGLLVRVCDPWPAWTLPANSSPSPRLPPTESRTQFDISCAFQNALIPHARRIPRGAGAVGDDSASGCHSQNQAPGSQQRVVAVGTDCAGGPWEAHSPLDWPQFPNGFQGFGKSSCRVLSCYSLLK